MSKREKKPPALPSTVREAFGKRFVKAIDLRELSQVDVAVECGVTRQAVNHWARGRGFPESAQLYTLCANHKISADYLLFGTPTEDDQVKAILDRVSKMTPEERRALLTLIAPKPHP